MHTASVQRGVKSTSYCGSDRHTTFRLNYTLSAPVRLCARVRFYKRWRLRSQGSHASVNSGAGKPDLEPLFAVDFQGTERASCHPVLFSHGPEGLHTCSGCLPPPALLQKPRGRTKVSSVSPVLPYLKEAHRPLLSFYCLSNKTKMRSRG